MIPAYPPRQEIKKKVKKFGAGCDKIGVNKD